MGYARSPARLIAVIAARGWTHSEAARRMGIPRTTLLGIIKGRVGIGLTTMERVEDHLPEYSRDWLWPRVESNGHGANDAAG